MSAADQIPLGSLSGSGEARSDFNYNPAPVLPPYNPIGAVPPPAPPSPTSFIDTTPIVSSAFSPNVETFAGKDKSYFLLSGGGGGSDTNLTVSNLTVTADASVAGALTVAGDAQIGSVVIGGSQITIPTLGANISLPVGTIFGDKMVEFGVPIQYSMPPVGSIIMWAGDATTLFEKYEFCQGQQRQKALFPELYAILGTTWGPETDTLFTFPNLQGRVPVGAGTLAGGGTYALGASGGAESHTLTVNDIPDHTHNVNGRYIVNLGAGDTQQTYNVGSTLLPGFPTLGVAGRTGTNPVSLLQPYAVVNYIIRART